MSPRKRDFVFSYIYVKLTRVDWTLHSWHEDPFDDAEMNRDKRATHLSLTQKIFFSMMTQ